jgi:hypothetical protein
LRTRRDVEPPVLDSLVGPLAQDHGLG